MYISHVQIENFRALKSVSAPLNQFSVIIGENDVGKTSFLFALEKFFNAKKLDDKDDWHQDAEGTSKDIVVCTTFSDPPKDSNLDEFLHSNGSIKIKKTFPYQKTAVTEFVRENGSTVKATSELLGIVRLKELFHLIPVRRDLNIQFSMNKTALLGKTLRRIMSAALSDDSVTAPLQKIQDALRSALAEPKELLEEFLRDQLHSNEYKLLFDDLVVDPIEGVTLKPRLSDDRTEDILIQNRGAGTQNNLIIALFRLIANTNTGSSLIFAMEEPENSLHPRAQRQLLSVIQRISQQSQVIVTTHSPVFIDRSNYESNILLTRTTNGNTIAKTFNNELLDEVRVDLGIQASDALLKGGGNCAILVEGNTEEEGFPTFMEMVGISEFSLGITIINMEGSDIPKVTKIVKLLRAYDIPCIVVLDADARKTANEMEKLGENSLSNIQKVFRLSKGTIEDYYPLDVIAEVINRNFIPSVQLREEDFDNAAEGATRLSNIRQVMHEKGVQGYSEKYFKRHLGGMGTRLMKERDISVDGELKEVFTFVRDFVKRS